MMKHIYYICLLLASTRKLLANIDTLKVLTKIHLSKSIQVTGQRDTTTHILIYKIFECLLDVVDQMEIRT